MKRIDRLLIQAKQLKEKYSNSCSININIHDYEPDNELSKLVTITINIFNNRDAVIKHTAYYQCIPNIIDRVFKKFQIGHFFMTYFEDDTPEKNELMDVYTYFMNSLVKKNNIIDFVSI